MSDAKNFDLNIDPRDQQLLRLSVDMLQRLRGRVDMKAARKAYKKHHFAGNSAIASLLAALIVTRPGEAEASIGEGGVPVVNSLEELMALSQDCDPATLYGVASNVTAGEAADAAEDEHVHDSDINADHEQHADQTTHHWSHRDPFASPFESPFADRYSAAHDDHDGDHHEGAHDDSHGENHSTDHGDHQNHDGQHATNHDGHHGGHSSGHHGNHDASHQNAHHADAGAEHDDHEDGHGLSSDHSGHTDHASHSAGNHHDHGTHAVPGDGSHSSHTGHADHGFVAADSDIELANLDMVSDHSSHVSHDHSGESFALESGSSNADSAVTFAELLNDTPEETQPLDDDLFSNVIDENGPIATDADMLALDLDASSGHEHHAHMTPAEI